jgi:hypothetical protein
MANWKILIASMAIVGVLVAGCDKKPVADANSTAGTPTETTGGDSTTPKTDGGSGTTEEPSGPSMADLPESLKHEAFQYYGLTNANPLNLTLKMGDQTRTGSVTAQLESIDGDSAKFKIIRSGDLGASLGNDVIVVTPEGIKIIESSLGQVTSEGLDVPAQLEVGKSWKTSHKIDSIQGPLEDSFSSKVVGTETVKTPDGDKEALVIEQTGTVTKDGTARDVTAKYWYVKDRGPVKLTMTYTEKGKDPTTITYEEVS